MWIMELQKVENCRCVSNLMVKIAKVWRITHLKQILKLPFLLLEKLPWKYMNFPQDLNFKKAKNLLFSDESSEFFKK